jgi:predicted HTH transcriptional regulator
MKIIKIIETNEGVTATELAFLLGKEVEEINEIIEKLIMKEFVEENGGVLNIIQNGKHYSF